MLADNGMGPFPRTLADGVTAVRYTPGKIIAATGKVTPCSVQGEACDGIFNDTMTQVRGGFGIGLLAPWDGGGLAIEALAYGATEPGESLIIKVSATDDLPKFASAADEGVAGDKIVADLARGSSSTGEDVADADGVFIPSILVRLREKSLVTLVGGDVIDQYLDFEIDLAGIAGSGDVVTDFVPGFAFQIISTKFVITTPVTTAAKAATLGLEIGATPVTGGVIALTSANATPDGKVINGTAVTANNIGSATDAISVVASAVTAFAEGAGTFKIRVRVAEGVAESE